MHDNLISRPKQGRRLPENAFLTSCRWDIPTKSNFFRRKWDPRTGLQENPVLMPAMPTEDPSFSFSGFQPKPPSQLSLGLLFSFYSSPVVNLDSPLSAFFFKEPQLPLFVRCFSVFSTSTATPSFPCPSHRSSLSFLSKLPETQFFLSVLFSSNPPRPSAIHQIPSFRFFLLLKPFCLNLAALSLCFSFAVNLPSLLLSAVFFVLLSLSCRFYQPSPCSLWCSRLSLLCLLFSFPFSRLTAVMLFSSLSSVTFSGFSLCGSLFFSFYTRISNPKQLSSNCSWRAAWSSVCKLRQNAACMPHFFFWD